MLENISLPSSFDEVEAMVAVRALSFAQEVGFSSIILEGNYERVINSLRSEETSFASSGHLIEDVKVIAQSFIGLLYLMLRDRNSVAHNFAGHSRHVSDLKVWMKGIPPHLNAVIVAN